MFKHIETGPKSLMSQWIYKSFILDHLNKIIAIMKQKYKSYI